MKKAIIILSAILIIVVIGTIALSLFAPGSIPLPMQNAPEQTPQAQTERITSRLLIRKIEELKDRAVYLQHREEGRRLVELTAKTEIPQETIENDSVSTTNTSAENTQIEQENE